MCGLSRSRSRVWAARLLLPEGHGRFVPGPPGAPGRVRPARSPHPWGWGEAVQKWMSLIPREIPALVVNFLLLPTPPGSFRLTSCADTLFAMHLNSSSPTLQAINLA